MKQEKKLEEAKRLYKDANADQRYVLESLFPELAEIEDVRIKKEIIAYIKTGTYHKDWIAWLEKQGNLTTELQKTYVEIGRLVKENCYLKEKQGEQKFVEWSEVDNIIVEGICLALEYSNESGKKIEKYENWLHSIKDRVHPKQEWSEEDIKMFVNIKACLRNANKDYSREIDWLKSLKPQPKNKWSEEDEEIYRKCICAMRASACGFPEEEKFVEQVDNWLKSLRHQKQWKPTEEQIKTCKEVYADILSEKGFDLGTVNNELNRLEEQLKKL